MGILVFAGRELTATQIIALAEPLGVSSTNVKSYLTRMVAEGTLIRRGRARLSTYQPSAMQLGRIEDIRERLLRREDSWDHSWILVAGYSPKSPAQKERLNAALWIDGFRMVNGTFLRPAWPLPWAELRGKWYAELMEGISLRGAITSASSNFRDLYAGSDLDSHAAALADKLEKIENPGSPSACYTALLRLSGEVIQLASHNPQLPAELVSADGLNRLFTTFRSVEAGLLPEAHEFLNGVLNVRIDETPKEPA